ncbi:hypothetical protein EC988_000286 [Linderina pennispora]|nr:hypothetical protein EC988_000286 [Linderina pennispora]
MSLKPFRIPETRLIVASDLVVQVTLTFRTDDDEELSYRYAQDMELQSLVQTSVVSLVNCGYTNGVARGPGFVLHQMRKKWPIGKRYIFTRDGEPLHSSQHKYFFQLEFVDDQQTSDQVPAIEVVELRGAPASPSASSIAGSVIEGLDALPLPPVAPLAYGEQLGETAYNGLQASVVERRRGSDVSMRGAASPGIRNQLMARDGEAMDVSPRSAGRVRRFVQHSIQQPAHFSPRQPQQPAHFSPRRYQPQSPPTSPRLWRPTSRSSTVSMSESRSGRPPVPPDGAAQRTPGSTHQRQRLVNSGWYRPLHGVSPLSRQPKSLSSEVEFLSAREESFQESSHEILRDPHAIGDSQPREAVTSKFKRKMLHPIDLRRSSRRRSSLSREIPVLESDTDVNTSDFTNIDTPAAPTPDRGSSLKVRMLAAPQSRIPRASSRSRGLSGASQQSRASANSRHRQTEDEEDGQASTVALTGTGSTSSVRSVAASPHCQTELPHSPPMSKPPRAAPTRAMTASDIQPTKSSLWSRLRAPFGGRVDKSPIRPSVRERIAAFNSMDQLGTDNSHTFAARPQSTESTYAFIGSNSRRSSLISPVGVRAESRTGGSTRTASPAQSNTSMVSARVQEAINLFTGTTPDKDTGVPVSGRTSATSGVKRAKPVNYDVDFISPTKRRRAHTQDEYRMAYASNKPDRSIGTSSGVGGLNPVTLVQRMAQRYPRP